MMSVYKTRIFTVTSISVQKEWNFITLLILGRQTANLASVKINFLINLLVVHPHSPPAFHLFILNFVKKLLSTFPLFKTEMKYLITCNLQNLFFSTHVSNNFLPLIWIAYTIYNENAKILKISYKHRWYWHHS